MPNRMPAHTADLGSSCGAADGISRAEGDAALKKAGRAIENGLIVALKGIGGFQLIVDGRNDGAVVRLRNRKRREEKPFALMYPDLATIRQDCRITELEQRALLSPETPIVLVTALPRSARSQIAPSVAPANPYLGVMLPYTPLHHLLLSDVRFPVVATSGNRSDEPICTEEKEAVDRLKGIADMFLVHNRPIVRPIDDSVIRIAAGRELMLRRARGYAPLPSHLPATLPTVLAVGGHLKNTVGLSIGQDVFVSQHIGDLGTVQAHSAFRRVASDLPRLYGVQIEAVACDLHPEYLSTKYAAALGPPCVPVQHHWAHVLACVAENDLAPPLLGVSWDGTGLGLDGTIWGGEFLVPHSNLASFERAAHFRQFRLPGAEAAIRQPCRTAFGLLHEMWGDAVFTRANLASIRALPKRERALLAQMLRKRVHAPLTSSAGRLFDAVASILGLRQRTSFEGQAALELESRVLEGIDGGYPFEVGQEKPLVIDWQPMIEGIIRDAENAEPVGVIAARFHNTLAEIIVAAARLIAEASVLLTGGCFQNRYLLERSIQQLTSAGFRPYWHQRVPPNDGGLAIGQVIGAAASLQGVRSETLEGAIAE